MPLADAPPAAIIFDWDNTLVDSWLPIHEALNATLDAMGHPGWSLDETKKRARESLRDAFPKLFGDRWERARDHYLGHFEIHHLDRMKALEEAETLLQALHGDGVWLGVVSNKTGRFLRREVNALGWERYFRSVVGAGDAAFDKPHRAPIDLVLSDSGIKAGPEVWFVGDTDIDMKCATGAGCTPVLLHSTREAALELGQKLRCFETLKSYQDCKRLLASYLTMRACKMVGQ